MIKYDKNLEYDNSPCDVGETRTNSSDVKLTNLKETFMDYNYGVQCGSKDCYSCGTQRYNCNELNRLDDEVDNEADSRGVSLETVLDNIEPSDEELSDIEADLEAQDWDLFGEDKI